ncbi:MAG: hypothetical protein K1X88_13875 [Nannocystaceae bacterium]|nr:hypothetical protein [Nannocystaceae bacterium]
MQAYASVRAPDGSRHELVHGDLIGRLTTAALPLDDARISEAHAMISLREGELRIIALRGGLAAHGRPVAEIALHAGLEITLARGVVLEVERVHLPSFVLGLEAPAIPARPLPPVASVMDEPLRVVAGHVDGAAAHVWCTGASWRVRGRDGDTAPLEPGTVIEVGGTQLHAIAIPLGTAGQTPTRAAGGVATPLRIAANFDTVHVHREGAPALVLGGVHARLVSELVALGGPAPWKVLAELLWPGEDDLEVLRSRFDVSLSRLRRKLKEARVRTDLVHTDGAGSVELLLYPHDHVDDRT